MPLYVTILKFLVIACPIALNFILYKVIFYKKKKLKNYIVNESICVISLWILNLIIVGAGA